MKLTPEQEAFLKFCHDFMLPISRADADHFVFYSDRTNMAWSAWQCRGAWVPPGSGDSPRIQRKFDEYSLHQPTYNWQVIFKTKDGHDWGRLTHAGDASLPAIEQWASQFCLANDLAGAHIERW